VIANGNPLDATPVEANYTELYNNDVAIATLLNTVETDINAVETNIDVVEAALKNYRSGLKVTYASASTVTIGVGECRSDNGLDTIVVTSPITVDIATSGANGLDTGSEAANTWYNPFVIDGPSVPTAGMFVKHGDTPTLPTGYTVKRQLPIAVRNDGSGNFRRFHTIHWGEQPEIWWDTSDGLAVVGSGTATVYTQISCSTFIPPISRVGVFATAALTTQVAIFIRESNGNQEVPTSCVSGQFTTPFYCRVNASQQIDYRVSSANPVNVVMRGFKVTEVA
jgi:hypothetical protein